ncbi:MAG: NAD(P)-dependent oxidoreductase [Lentisphaerae bacterium]|jgi:nucleoside-diphosphate-sugar epimerase|nr:NAD(P)-dependent oxidoreductase [Lentisphaerota bacterium]MBT4817016.1 NAD(P)-dependent oxidoreductase [Lentisphaerota bacterium]MBT5604718.1 NAD(P)-dependent oxidoreductase [Lentisphaerota bacterium]MBT7058108.1 NAD(P)-dependent oxidoreductase [Lentisphaerota bacterium]MBT7841796.1 NAD(P)-dependent oxidoreductase [Lentisphaerota bacterium]
MNVVVLGAAGWTGRAVLANLAGKHAIRAFARNAHSWDAYSDLDGPWDDGEIMYGDMTDYHAVDRAMEGMDGVIHVAAHLSGGDDNADTPFLVNVKGMWNVLETARKHGIKRVVHVGSCQTVHPEGVFFSAEIRRPDATRYAVCKRLQEEMCRQFHDAHGMSIVVLRPDGIVDAKLGIGYARRPLGNGQSLRPGTVCRHDFAEACRLALETPGIGLEILHITGMPEASEFCNCDRAREVLGLEFRADFNPYR